MTGKTHYRIGIMYYLIFSILPLMASIPVFKGNAKISLAGIGAAALGALVVDSDTERSLINQMNPITQGVTSFASSAEVLLKRILRLLIGFTAGFLILDNLDHIVGKFGPDDRTYIISYIVAFTCIFAGVTSERFMLRLPVISGVYSFCSYVIRVCLAVFKRFAVLIFYITAGILILWYNFRHGNVIILYIAAVILLGTALFPHRTFLHSIEGFLLYSTLANYIASVFGYPQLGVAFSIGYFSHIYLADILTNNGVLVSALPTLFRKVGLHDRLMEFKLYRLVNKVLDAKLSISVMSTGSSSGNVFEYIYCSILIILVTILVANKYNNLTLMLT